MMSGFIKKNFPVIVSLAAIFIIVFISNYGKFSGDKFEDKLNSVIPQDNQDFSFTDTIINISALIDPNMDRKETAASVDRVVNDLRKEIGQEGNAHKIISIINDYFFNTRSFAYEKGWNDGAYSREEFLNSYSIGRMIKSRQSICLTMSVLYLIVGEKLGLPFYGVLMPGHIYVRYREQGKSGINIETTYSGVEIYQYAKYSGLSDLMLEKSVYGKELTPYKVLGAYLNNISSGYGQLGNNKKAEIFALKALDILPDMPEAYMALVTIYLEQKKFDKALLYANKAMDVFPGQGMMPLAIAAIYLEKKQYSKAREYAEEAKSTGRNDKRVQKIADELIKEIDKEEKNAG